MNFSGITMLVLTWHIYFLKNSSATTGSAVKYKATICLQITRLPAAKGQLQFDFLGCSLSICTEYLFPPLPDTIPSHFLSYGFAIFSIRKSCKIQRHFYSICSSGKMTGNHVDCLQNNLEEILITIQAPQQRNLSGSVLLVVFHSQPRKEADREYNMYLHSGPVFQFTASQGG